MADDNTNVIHTQNNTIALIKTLRLNRTSHRFSRKYFSFYIKYFSFMLFSRTVILLIANP